MDKNLAETSNDVDMSIFTTKALPCTNRNNYQNCPAIHRLTVALKYYSALNVKDDDDDREIFRSFMNEIYTNAVNDYTHLIDTHSDQLQAISEHIIGKTECKMAKCKATRRHFESEQTTNIKNDEKMNFFMNMFDSLHFWIYHSFEGGFRLKPTKDENEQIEMDKSELFDAEFAKLQSRVRGKAHLTDSFERISPSNNTKFTISIQTEKDDTTFLDELYRHLESDSIQNDSVEKLKQFVAKEAFDTDTIKTDLKSKNDGNIGTALNNEECVQSISRFIASNAARAMTFSLGYRFYYWEHYKKLTTLPNNEQFMSGDFDNTHDHSGYKVSDLYVTKKYDTFKDEIMNYPHFDIDNYNEAKTKALEFMKSAKIKKITAKKTDGRNFIILHYGIDINSGVLFDHILSSILYTDYSKLSTAFSGSFRKSTNFESLKSIKRRNALYYWMSRRLRELVEYFGQCSRGSSGGYWSRNANDSMKGPYYSGMGCKLNIPSFAMRLNSPSSTSKQLTVAIKFSGPEGIVFTFDNPYGSYTEPYHYLRGWDCSWMSRFAEEDERLFFGGFYRIKVVNLRLIKTNQAFQEFVTAIFHLDAILSANHLGSSVKKGKNDYKIFKTFMDTRLGKKSEKKRAKLPQFISDCMVAFAENKKLIIMKCNTIWHYASQSIKDLFFSPLDYRRYGQEMKRADDDFSNVVRKEIFMIFPKVTKFIIQTTQSGDGSYSFSLIAFLSMICQTHLKKIIIKAQFGYTSSNWLSVAWNGDKERLIKEYGAKGYKIEMESTKAGYSTESHLIITAK